MTLEAGTIGKITASRSTFNTIVCILHDARRCDEMLSEKYYNEGDEVKGEIFKDCARIDQKHIDIIYNALKATGYYDDLEV